MILKEGICFLGSRFFLAPHQWSCGGDIQSVPYVHTVEHQWLEHLWDYENFLETRVVRAIEGLFRARSGGVIGISFRFTSTGRYIVCSHWNHLISSPGRSPGRAIVLPLALALAAALTLAKSLTLKFFMWWARRCQASYPARMTGLVEAILMSTHNIPFLNIKKNK